MTKIDANKKSNGKKIRLGNYKRDKKHSILELPLNFKERN